jgi:SAM-dependent methyltransferase
MSVAARSDLYRGAASRWAAGADLAYEPLAVALVAESPVPLARARVLDVGTGTGAGSRALLAAGARPVAVDLEEDMVRHDAARRPPAFVGDVLRLPVATGSVDHAVAPFVVNHLTRPAPALAEIARCVRSGGVVLASTFDEDDRPPLKDRIDAAMVARGWEAPPAYRDLREQAMPLTGTVERLREVAVAAGLTDGHVERRRVDVGLAEPADLVAYRLGMAQFAPFLDDLGQHRRAALEADVVAEVARHHDGSPLVASVLHLTAVVPR